MYVSEWVCAHESTACGSMLDPLEMGLQVVVSHLVRTLGTKLESSSRVVRVLNC